ncbi:MlaC/ttg2D family ABC transporter substrate-binding protein [Phaeobacter gallaeciensis]|uniref:Toluene tolerance protein, Ttg2 family n=1 Tax=Phaeobacter gallaeciensis TaxID=60890 RepID=A0AAC9Z689_9RHOB|nr:ABC transporter substrate-binding protein [Phaeobacter gallaeciensis]AHD08286.1 ABC-type transport system [Phaeobacter gallaeciensis DSM 26640]ATE91552.1 putative toluene tolerance protein, Ttg2 family [Phaeobacter gallaeciensis]ATE95828.1 putative toluene tolerance protein, Ttg2 family [Phaeobacter gallaeciensis]ATF00168.1 putative toluene tolerance protein, Ttg2 family [Phaeobacter gallaeciensis]ATF04600.1 putative toluene tolerance protein, Ttg2 family [Phaeobacter gallaeciensis]
MPSNFLTRRSFLATGAAFIGLAALPGKLLALTESGARNLVGSVVGDINKVIASGKSEGAMIRDFEKIFVRYADVNIMARYALGVDARRASASQMRAFSGAFQSYIARKYGKRFREFIGGSVEVQSARKIKAGYEIKSLAKLQGQAPFEVTFLVSDKSGRDKFYNMFIEGVNLLLTERTEIGAILDRNKGDINKLIAELKRLS